MSKIKIYAKKYLTNLVYFYQHLRYRLFVLLFLSILVGVLDGFGIAMFIPLLEFIASDANEMTSQSMGNLSFIMDIFAFIGVEMSLTSILSLMFIFFSLKGLMKFLESYKNVVYLQYFIRTLREDNINALAEFSFQEFVNSDVGRIQNTMSGEVSRVVSGYRHYMRLLQLCVLIFVYTLLAFLANPQFALLVSVGGILSNALFNKLYVATKKLSKRFTGHNHGFQGLLIQQIAQFKYLKATGLLRSYSDKLIAKVYDIEDTSKKMGILGSIITGVREPMIIGIVIIVILIQVNILGGSLAVILLSILFFYRALGSVLLLQNAWNSFLSTSGSLENVKQFTKELNSNKEKTGTVRLEKFDHKIELRGVYFKFGNTKILKDISLSIYKNETIAIVGESGSGKTTLMNIICGLLKPYDGEIRIDDHNFKELDLRSLQQRIGYITQEPVVFNDTIFNNISFWDKYNEENRLRLLQAIKKSQLDSFINSLPKGYNTLLGNNGINLSGGQKQRLSIARELYKNIDFLFMDEATSALDSETERQIQENLELLRGSYTIIIIAHRLSTIKSADRVVVLDNGKIQNVGTYAELMKESGKFKRMVELQEL